MLKHGYSDKHYYRPKTGQQVFKSSKMRLKVYNTAIKASVMVVQLLSSQGVQKCASYAKTRKLKHKWFLDSTTGRVTGF